jgi:hypothetical protein
MRKLLLLLVALLCGVLTIPAFAQEELYDNGPTDGLTLGWTINFGFGVSDQFTLGADSAVGSIQFAAWLFPGDVLETAEVAITSSEFGGTSYFDQTLNFTQSGCFANGLGYNVCTETGELGFVDLHAGSYWLNLGSGVVNSGDPVYWDQNSGPSRASESSLGTIPSESFTILAPCEQNSPGCGPPPPTTPEPNSLLLVASGFIVAAAGMKLLR